MSSNAITVIHKFIRREMFDFSQQVFRADPQDCAALRSAFATLVELLQGHAAQEDARFEPLLREVDPNLAERMTRDHRRLEDQLQNLVHVSNQLDSRASNCRGALLRFHLDWNRYLSAYLAHLDDEERTLFVALGEKLPPLSFIAESAKSRGTQGEEFLLKLWAVTTCEERFAIEQAAGM
jgi:hypothetical protein